MIKKAFKDLIHLIHPNLSFHEYFQNIYIPLTPKGSSFSYEQIWLRTNRKCSSTFSLSWMLFGLSSISFFWRYI